MTITGKVVSVIGCGSLGSAIVEGLLKQGHAPAKIIATRRNLDRLQALKSRGVTITDDNALAVESADIIVLAVPPSQMASLIQELAEQINHKDVPVVSVVAGLSLDSLASKLDVKLIRSMPNVASSLGMGATIFQVQQGEDKEGESESLSSLANELFAPLGIVIRANSAAEVNSFTAICGCGPAYFFYFVKIICDYGLSRGLSHDQVHQATIQTIKGATALLESSSKSAEELINTIAVPDEPTATRRALDYMKDQGIEDIILRACAQAEARANEMGQEIATGMENES